MGLHILFDVLHGVTICHVPFISRIAFFVFHCPLVLSSNKLLAVPGILSLFES